MDDNFEGVKVMVIDDSKDHSPHSRNAYFPKRDVKSSLRQMDFDALAKIADSATVRSFLSTS